MCYVVDHIYKFVFDQQGTTYIFTLRLSQCFYRNFTIITTYYILLGYVSQVRLLKTKLILVLT